MNTGKREIRAEDFDGEVLVKTSPRLIVKSAYTVRHKEGMRHNPACYWREHECGVEGVLYNRGDWVDVQLLVDTLNAEDVTPADMPLMEELDMALRIVHNPITVDAVIAGQTRPARRLEAAASVRRANIVFYLNCLTFLLVSSIGALSIVYLRSR